jgi:hypothetical protein
MGKILRCFYLVLLNHTLNNVGFAFDAVQRNPTGCSRKNTKNSVGTAREIVGSSYCFDDLANLEPVTGHDTPPKAPKDRAIIAA